MKIVHVKWRDSIHSQGWQSTQEFKNFCKEPDPVLDSIGLLAHDSEDYIVIIQTAGVNNIDAMMKIPRCSITDMIELGELEVVTE